MVDATGLAVALDTAENGDAETGPTHGRGEVASGNLEGDGLDDGAVPGSEVLLPWYRRRWVKVVLVRIMVRLSMIGLIVGLSFAFSFKSVVRKYSAWIHGFHPQISSVALFTTFATVFASVAPGQLLQICDVSRVVCLFLSVVGATFPAVWRFPSKLFNCARGSSVWLSIFLLRVGFGGLTQVLCCQDRMRPSCLRAPRTAFGLVGSLDTSQ